MGEVSSPFHHAVFFVFVFEGVLIFVNIGQCHLPPVARGAGASRAVLWLFLPAPFALTLFFCVCARIIKSYQIDFEELPSTINVYTVIPVY